LNAGSRYTHKVVYQTIQWDAGGGPGVEQCHLAAERTYKRVYV